MCPGTLVVDAYFGLCFTCILIIENKKKRQKSSFFEKSRFDVEMNKYFRVILEGALCF